MDIEEIRKHIKDTSITTEFFFELIIDNTKPEDFAEWFESCLARPILLSFTEKTGMIKIDPQYFKLVPPENIQGSYFINAGWYQKRSNEFGAAAIIELRPIRPRLHVIGSCTALMSFTIKYLIDEANRVYKVRELEPKRAKGQRVLAITWEETERPYKSTADALNISPELLNRLRKTLLNCGPFANTPTLKAMFMDARISPWRERLPLLGVSSSVDLVDVTVNYLNNAFNIANENALVLFLSVLSDRFDPGDACHQQLAELANELAIEGSHYQLSASKLAVTPILSDAQLPVGAGKDLPAIIQPSTSFEPELILIPAGKFLMGSDPQKDKDARDNEQPQHIVYLPDYYIGKTPVTNAQYQAFVRATDYPMPYHWKNDHIPQGKEDHPVVWVDWNDAVAYCQWLAKATGKDYRLPTEAEWEKAARGTDGRIYPWGNVWNESCVNTGGVLKPLMMVISPSPIVTTPVGKYSPQGDSPYGCEDMAGNVWEWTSSLWGDAWRKPDFGYPYNPDDGREDMKASGYRVVRGGAYWNNASIVRCAFRFRRNWFVRNLVYWGLRVCVAAPFSPDSER